MAGRISELSVLTAIGAAGADLVEVVDVSDTTMGAGGTNKKMALGDVRAVLPYTNEVAVGEGGYTAGFAYSFNGGIPHNAALNQPAGYLFLIPAVFAFDTVISAVGMILGGTTAAERRFWLSLYADNGSTVPAARVATFGEIVLPNATAAGIKTITGLSVPVSANRLYWAGLTPNYTNNGTDYWCTSSGGLYPRTWVQVNQALTAVGRNTGYVTPPDPAGTIDVGLGGYGAPFIFFQV